MAAVSITVSDLTPFVPNLDTDKANEMITDAMATAVSFAPCIADEFFPDDKAAAAKAIIRRALLRWAEGGVGGTTTKQATFGPYSKMETTDTRTGDLFWPSEINGLINLCKDVKAKRGAFSVDTAPRSRRFHADICSLNLGANYCSCGADIAGEPIYEV